MASRREQKERRASTASSGQRGRARALLIGAIVAAIVGFGAAWLAQMWTDRTPEERAHEKVGEVRERVRDFTH
jgi:ferric-dicitrate binding protein FerR (iron transport regulator)